MLARAVNKAFLFLMIVWLSVGQSSRQLTVQADSASFLLAPTPNWVKNEPLITATPEQIQEARDGVIRLLSDQQVRVTGASTERYFHQAEQIVAQPGIEHASQLQLDFDPTYQRLTIHRISLKRGTQNINALKPREIKLVQQESELEERLFNGTLSALVILNDVRVGDIIEYDYSLNGENPILAGRFADVTYLIESEPVAKLRYRLLWPTARPLKHAVRGLSLEPKIQAQGELTEYLWERDSVPAPDLNTNTDSLSNSLPILHLSEFQSWQEIVNWALPLYQQPASLAPKLRQQVDAWQKASTDPEQRLLKALRFVQDEIRYLGIEMGKHSHLPHAPALVMERRYGDCKDKALLLCTLLNGMGITAQPALVNTELYEQVNELPPSPYAFDHVIVRAQLEGKEYWFDATSSLDRGALSQHINPNFGRGLPIQSQTTDLAEIPVAASKSPLKTVLEVYTLGDENTATLEVTSIYRGSEANAMRSFLATSSLKDVAQERLRAYSDKDRSVTADGKLQVNDDAVQNILTLNERYQVGRFWKENKRLLVADRISQELPWVNLNAPETEQDKNKLIRLAFPLDVEHVIEVHGAALPERSDVINHEALSLRWSHVQNSNTARLSYRLRSLRPSIKAGDSRQLNEAIERMEDATKVQISSSGNFAYAFDQQARVVGLLGLLLMPLLAWMIVKWLQLKQRRQAAATVRSDNEYTPPGATPAAAIALPHQQAMQETLSRMACHCGAAYADSRGSRWTLLFDGQRISATQLRCSACGESRDVHFVLSSEQSDASSPAVASEEGA